jgi:hypothetical protein
MDRNIDSGAVRTKASADIFADHGPKEMVTLGADDTPVAVQVDYPSFWMNMQPDKDVYYHWSRRTPESRYTSVVSLIDFEDGTLGGFANGTGIYALNAFATDANSVLIGEDTVLGVTAAGANQDRFVYDTAIALTAGLTYVIRFYAKGVNLNSSGTANVLAYFFAGDGASPGALIAGTYTAISGKLQATTNVPIIESNEFGWYEFTFTATATSAGYLHFWFENTSGLALSLYLDNFSIVSIRTEELRPFTALDPAKALFLYGDSEYERRIRWGVISDRSEAELYLVLQRKTSATTTVRLAEG